MEEREDARPRGAPPPASAVAFDSFLGRVSPGDAWFPFFLSVPRENVTPQDGYNELQLSNLSIVRRGVPRRAFDICQREGFLTGSEKEYANA